MNWWKEQIWDWIVEEWFKNKWEVGRVTRFQAQIRDKAYKIDGKTTNLVLFRDWGNNADHAEVFYIERVRER